MTVGTFRLVVTKNRFPELKGATKRATTAALEECAWELNTDVGDRVAREGLVRTGKYQNSWTVQRPSDTERWVISAGATYGAYLEYGHRANPGQVFPLIKGNTLVGFRRVRATTTWVPARPHVRPVADAWRGGRLARRYREKFQRYMYKFAGTD